MGTELREEGHAGRQCESAPMAAATTQGCLADARRFGLLSKATFWEEISREAMRQLSAGDGELVSTSLLQSQHSAGCSKCTMVKPQR